MNTEPEVSEEAVFPAHLITSMRRSRFYVILRDEITTEEDVSALIQLMTDRSEDDFYYFWPETSQCSTVLNTAIHFGRLRLDPIERHYYEHPRFKRDFVRIIPGEEAWDWEREHVQIATPYIRGTIKLTERSKRERLVQEIAATHPKPPPTELVEVKPGLAGVSVNVNEILRRLWSWMKRLRAGR